MKPLSSMLLFAISIYLYGSTLVLSRTPADKPMYMVFARHPGKSNKNGADAPLSGGQNDKVNAVENGIKVLPAWTSPQALDLRTNGLEQMLGVLKAGKYLKLIFRSLGQTKYARWWNAHPDQKVVFQKMKDVFTENAKYSFETSDLRRAQLEAIALRKSFEEAGLGGNKLKNSPFYIVHNMGEKWTLNTVLYNMRSYSAFETRWLVQAPGGRFKIVQDEYKRDYMAYLRGGMPKPGWKLNTDTGAPERSGSFLTVNNKISGYVRSKLLGGNGGSGRLEWSGQLDEVNNFPVFTKYVYPPTGRLRKDWTSDVDVIVAVGSGGWYKDMVKLKSKGLLATSGGCSNTKPLADKLKRQLDYTEFVLLEWKFSAHGHMRIVDAWTADDLRFYDLERWVPTQAKMRNLARDEDFGDDNDYQDYAESEEYDDEFDEYDEDNDYSAYDDYDEYDDDFEYYYGEYYGEDDDNDLYEESLYEAALENLIKAQKQFAVAQRLMAPQRRMKAPAHSYH